MPKDIIYGFHGVLAAIDTRPETVEAIWLEDRRTDKRGQHVMEAAQAAHITVQRLPRIELDHLAGAGARHQGVVARIQNTPGKTEKDLPQFLEQLTESPFLLVLDGVQDPYNLGACLRSAEAAGVQAVILPKDRTAPLSATARKAASGAAEMMPVFRVANLARVLESMKARGIWIVGAADGTETGIYAADFKGPLALVLGGEGKGLRRLTRERCDCLVSIPMSGSIESLNVSVAAGICLFEAVRQRQGSQNN